MATWDTKHIRLLLFWSCELLFLHFISINLVLFVQRFCNISRFMKMNNTTIPRVSGDYTDSYAVPATSDHSFPSVSLHFAPSLLLFHFSAFDPLSFLFGYQLLQLFPSSLSLSSFHPSPLYVVTLPLCYLHWLTLSRCLYVQ